METIYIVGAGAIGKVLAVFLKLEKKKVIIIRGSVDDYSGHIEKIQVLLNGTEEMEAEIEISTLNKFPVLNGIVVLTNKSYGNQRLSEILKFKINNTPIVLLQNGLDVEQPFINNSFSQIYRCVLFATSQPLAENRYSFKPVSVSPIGVIKGNEENLSAIVRQLNSPYFKFKAEPDIQPMIWTKAIVNSVFNSICPLLETDNGIFYKNNEAFDIAKSIIEECIAIAEEKGITLDADSIANTLLLISKSSDGQLISTYQDIQNKRSTEIQSLNLAILRIAESMNKSSIVTKTALLGELIKIKSELNQ